MSKVIRITDTLTGETRTFTDEYWTDDDLGDFIWTEGNYACDCNRALFFKRAIGESTDDDETPCGDSRYEIEFEGEG